MPDSDNADNVETRLTRVEHDVAQLREESALARADATAARVLAAGADHEVSEVRAELRAHTQVLNALRQTQLEQGQKIDGLELRLDGLEREMRDGFATMQVGMAQITALLTAAIGSEQD